MPINTINNKVYQFDLNGNLIQEFDNTLSASLFLNINRTTINSSIYSKHVVSKQFYFSRSNVFKINKKSNISSHKMYNKLLKEFHPTLNGQLKLSDFNYGTHKKVWWKCDVAEDHVWEAPICDRTINESGCLCCNGKKVVVSNSLATMYPKIAKEWHSTKNIPSTPFDITFGSSKKTWWKCNHNHEWIATVNSVVNSVNSGGTGCPICYDSNGEKKIKNILDQMNIHYENQKTFDDCKDTKKLRFDFYLLKYNLLIEYDGIQHFKQSDFFGGTKGFESYKKRDRIKNEYADKNNIPLLRIPYTKFDLIEDEINYFLRKHTNHDT